jgi:hypothetical protein
MHGSMNVKSPNNTSKWQMGFNSAFKGLKVNVKFTREQATKAQRGNRGITLLFL